MRAVQDIHMDIPQTSRVSDLVLSIHEGSSITSRVIDDGGTTKRRDGSSVSQSG